MTRMIVAASCLISTLALAQAGPTSVPERPTGAEAEIRLLHKEYEDAWNRHDAKEIARMWVDDGDYTEPDGRTVFGRDEVGRLLEIEHASVFKHSRLHLAVERVRMLRDDVAVVDGSYELFNAYDPTGKPIGTRAGYFTSTLVKDDRAWKVSAARLFLPAQLIWREK